MKLTHSRRDAAEHVLRELLNGARHHSQTRYRMSRAIPLWMTDCASRTLHIFEVTQPQELRVRRELVRAEHAFARKTVRQPAELARAWVKLQDIAQQTADQNFTAAAWAVRSVAWVLKDDRTAWNCAAAARNAVKESFPKLENAELTWQTERLQEYLQNTALEVIIPGMRYHP